MNEELDEWFKLEEEKLEKKFFNKTQLLINKGLSFDDVKEEFKKKHKKLIFNYEKNFYLNIKKEKWKKLLIRPIIKLNKGMDKFIKAFREE